MPRLSLLNYLIFFMGAISLVIIAVPFAGGEIFSREKNDALRIIYSGGLTGNFEPCG